MEVRRKLEEFFQDPQLDGVIVVERPSCPAAAIATQVPKPSCRSAATRIPEPSCPDAAFVTRVPEPSCPAAAIAATQIPDPSCSAAATAIRVPKPSCSPAATRIPDRSCSAAASDKRVPEPSCRDAATRVSEPSSTAARGVLPPSCSSTPSLPPRRRTPLPEGCAMFQCRGCRAVLGDSLHLCAQEPRLGVLVCFKVANGVSWEDSLAIGLEGFPLGCAYYSLFCQSCGWIVGFILYSATRHLAHLRGFFCLFKDSILCYLLKKQITVEATNMNFPDVTLKRRLEEMKEKLVGVHARIEMLMKKLEELEQKYNVAEKQSSTSEVAGLPPGYAIVRVN